MKYCTDTWLKKFRDPLLPKMQIIFLWLAHPLSDTCQYLLIYRYLRKKVLYFV